MLNLIKNLSHRVRLFSKQKPNPVSEIEIGVARSVTKVDDHGRLVTSIEYVTDYRPSSQYRVSDFALENLLAANVDLTDVNLHSSSFVEADSAIHQIANLKK